MTINNRNTIIKYNIRRYILIVSFGTLISIIAFTSIFEIYLKDINKILVAIIASILYCIYIAYYYILDYNYIHYTDEGLKFIFHYVSLNPFNKKRNAIEILKSNFSGFKLKKSFLGQKTEIILFTKTKKGIAKYPPISITSLSQKQINALVYSLS
ncbi:MAG: hypothetical protein A2X13_06950 [Bacteroidetes bacterium GWC2_33_15]|nr:MAG: hypothetical protein A2X10_11755 [Bacteroidetes bacterium GWA2_33_15]OFX51218.1 MAG: hypothetical protein A2X13_06950 [Bacteroidetes bacterium GWC2_33_15]OFX66328.1 MAG: hypothetical protein A2X15_00005 [Bacteroidetes bacterium GWB2_32_14]OFX70621.1 MAG: hypothetical protein A2X14_10690 [Bacteroidetes bacterium GWD2_33_33]HAN18795.1 hypothetical protein [Bacteroidales bacterium]